MADVNLKPEFKYFITVSDKGSDWLLYDYIESSRNNKVQHNAFVPGEEELNNMLRNTEFSRISHTGFNSPVYAYNPILHNNPYCAPIIPVPAAINCPSPIANGMLRIESVYLSDDYDKTNDIYACTWFDTLSDAIRMANTLLCGLISIDWYLIKIGFRGISIPIERINTLGEGTEFIIYRFNLNDTSASKYITPMCSINYNSYIDDKKDDEHYEESDGDAEETKEE